MTISHRKVFDIIFGISAVFLPLVDYSSCDSAFLKPKNVLKQDVPLRLYEDI